MANKQDLAKAAPSIGPLFCDAFERTILLDRGGTTTHRLMLLSWVIVVCIGTVDAIWIAAARAEFAPSNWAEIVRTAGVGLLMLLLFELIIHRLKKKQDPIGRLLRAISIRLEMATVATIVFAMLGAVVITFCCLAAAAALPLQDVTLASMDASLGFDWNSFLSLSNSHEAVASFLLSAYQNTGSMVFITMFWLCLSSRFERLAEFVAMLCLTAVGLAIGQLILPAAGAYSFHHPVQELFSRFGADTGMWHHNLLMQFRSDHPPSIDFTTPSINCLVTFPSGHTILGLVTTYALRDRFYTLIPAIIFNAIMIASTLPVGGHYLMDLIASGGITLLSIICIRAMLLPRIMELPSSNSTLVGAA